VNIDRLVVHLIWLRLCLLHLFLLDFFTQNIFLSVVFSPSATITVFCMLIPSHNSPVFGIRGPKQPMAKLVVRALGYRSSARLPLGGVCDTVGSTSPVAYLHS